MEYKEFCFNAKVYNDYEYGETIYVVETERSKWRSASVSLTEKCPVCDDSHKIKVRGYEFDCPMCKSARNNTSVFLGKWVVTPFIINSFEVHGDARKGAYAPSRMCDLENLPTVRFWHGFNKAGTDIRSRDFSETITKEFDPNTITLTDVDHFSEKVFRDKKLAVAVCRKLHELQKEKLKKFNDQHDTAHEYPFDIDKCVTV